MTLHFEIVVSAGKVADLQRVGMLSSWGEFSISLGQSAPLPPPPPSSLLPSSSSLPSSLAPPLSSFDSFGSASFPAPASRAPVVLGTGASYGVPPSASGASTPVLSGAAGSLDPNSAFFVSRL